MKIRIKTGVNMFIERGREKFELEHTLQGVKLIFFFLIATWLLNSSKW